MSQSLTLLKAIYLFQDLSPTELNEIVKLGKQCEISSGQEIFLTGEKAKSLFLILIGGVKIYATSEEGDQLGIAQLGSGAHFGELGFFDGGARSATAAAKEPTELLEIEYDRLMALCMSQPEVGLKVFRACSRFLATRLRSTLGDLNAAKEARLKMA